MTTTATTVESKEVLFLKPQAESVVYTRPNAILRTFKDLLQYEADVQKQVEIERGEIDAHKRQAWSQGYADGKAQAEADATAQFLSANRLFLRLLECAEASVRRIVEELWCTLFECSREQIPKYIQMQLLRELDHIEHSVKLTVKIPERFTQSSQKKLAEELRAQGFSQVNFISWEEPERIEITTPLETIEINPRMHATRLLEAIAQDPSISDRVYRDIVIRVLIETLNDSE